MQCAPQFGRANPPEQRTEFRPHMKTRKIVENHLVIANEVGFESSVSLEQAPQIA